MKYEIHINGYVASQPDFLNQKPLLQEIIESYGHKIIFYPKFHCELNYMEMYWELQKDMLVKIVIILGQDLRTVPIASNS